MSTKISIGCDKCNGVVEIERSIFSNEVHFRIKNGEFKDKFGAITIFCKNKDSKRNTTCLNEIKRADKLISGK